MNNKECTMKPKTEPEVSTTTKIITTISLILFLIFIIMVFVYSKHEESQLHKEPMYINATVYKTYYYKGDKLQYEFNLYGKRYQGSGGYYPNKENIEIGDSCWVIYQKSNPENNRLDKGENKRVIVKKPVR